MCLHFLWFMSRMSMIFDHINAWQNSAIALAVKGITMDCEFCGEECNSDRPLRRWAYTFRLCERCMKIPGAFCVTCGYIFQEGLHLYVPKKCSMCQKENRWVVCCAPLKNQKFNLSSVALAMSTWRWPKPNIVPDVISLVHLSVSCVIEK